MEKLYTVSRKQDWELTVAQNELLIAKFRLKLKKVGKTTRPFRYDLNQIPSLQYPPSIPKQTTLLQVGACPSRTFQ